MRKPIVLDTDVLVDYLRGHGKAIGYVSAHATRIILSSIVVAELHAGVRGEEELNTLDSFLATFPVIPVSAELARRGGLWKHEYHASHGVGLADAIVAATAELQGAELKTLNTKHYPMLSGLRPPYTRR